MYILYYILLISLLDASYILQYLVLILDLIMGLYYLNTNIINFKCHLWKWSRNASLVDDMYNVHYIILYYIVKRDSSYSRITLFMCGIYTYKFTKSIWRLALEEDACAENAPSAESSYIAENSTLECNINSHKYIYYTNNAIYVGTY